MVKAGFLSWVRSNDKEIIDKLEAQSANLVKATSALVELIANYDNIVERKEAIKELEHKGDEITHDLYTIIDKTFVTPLDREDISKLTGAVDEILDYTDGTAERFLLFKIREPTPFMVELAKTLMSASQEVHLLMTRLRRFKNAGDLIEHCRRISKYEHEADTIYRKAIAELFETNDPILIIKLKEIYEVLEGALDRCADVSDVFEDIALKYG
jgi:predicted phosphate transport protein (TIGR00153 family)